MVENALLVAIVPNARVQRSKTLIKTQLRKRKQNMKR